MSTEMDDKKNVSFSKVEENNARQAVNAHENEESVVTIDESLLIGTSFTDNDQNSILDEEALLKSPEASYIEEKNVKQHSTIDEDNGLVQQSYSTAEESFVKDSPIEEYRGHQSNLVANIYHREENSEKNKESIYEDLNLVCSHMKTVNNDPVDSAEEKVATGFGAVSEPYPQSKICDSAIVDTSESEEIHQTSKSEVPVNQTVDQQATEVKLEEFLKTTGETEHVSEDESVGEMGKRNLIIPIEDAETDVESDINKSEIHQNEMPQTVSDTNTDASVNEEEVLLQTSTIESSKENQADIERKEEVVQEEEETAVIREQCDTEVINEKEETETVEVKKETEVINEYSVIPSVVQISPSPEVKSSEINLIHHIKNIQFKDNKIGIVTQNENGPCPLVAIINVLLLKHQITLPALCEIASASKLMEYIGNTILENIPKNLSGEARLNYEMNMHDAMAVLPKLQTGLDVNVRFTGVRDFEYTPECIIFDLLRIPLYHGWLVDPQTPEIVATIGNASYNQIVEKAISQKCSNNADSVTQALIIENFLERTASQLTYHGLSELNSATSEEEIGVLFRNNHFSTIYKHGNELLQLVTDQGFLTESSVVWETLSSIDGDGQFVDGLFRTVPPKPECTTRVGSSSAESSLLTAEQQIDQDFLVALSLQDQPETPQEELVSPTTMANSKSTQEFLDAKLARELQREEERRAAEAEANRGATAQATHQAETPQAKKKDGCTIL